MKHVIVSTPIEWLDTTDSSREHIGSYTTGWMKLTPQDVQTVVDMEFVRDMVRQSYRPREIFVNNGVTVCKFADGDVVTSKPREGEPFDIEVGVAMCIVKKLYGGRGRWLSYLRDKVKYQERKVKK